MQITVVLGRRVIAVALSAAAIVVGATACGASASHPAASSASSASAVPLAGLTADQIVRKAAADFKAASSVHVTGSGQDSGDHIAVNMTLGTKGCNDTVSEAGKGTFVLVRIGQKVWLKGDSQFWKAAVGSSSPAVQAYLDGKYVEVSATDASVGSLLTMCSMSGLFGQFGPPPSGLVKGKVTTILGQAAQELSKPGQGVVYVSLSSVPELMRIDGGSDGQMNFTGYNAPLNLTPPPAADTIDGTKLGF